MFIVFLLLLSKSPSCKFDTGVESHHNECAAQSGEISPELLHQEIVRCADAGIYCHIADEPAVKKLLHIV